MQAGGRTVDLEGVRRGFGANVAIAHVELLEEFAESVFRCDAARSERARERLRRALGDPGFVDAAATVAAFHGFVRLADATGIPYTTAARGHDAPEIRERAGVNDFRRVRGEA